ncbi:hypothetical protein V499_00506 [Pseudogymnoascus sp. VKM F-103]|uniref:Beta-galactosidase n=1 Tax=Pseudogymnoascus verrucosus TaxID=342668 RepID=A0A1B8GB01_9PEZI|nr:uncharacterized protein VE01_08593 [Pseudogymnoascus verrucosus]KFY80678.1 hypothetical protein V499_00506 [Pseudogymnoascus sp. VKM F-103]OBT93029.1 hypothetical protein VE01_08593 [Pseudogymnoascus verrucosus]
MLPHLRMLYNACGLAFLLMLAQSAQSHTVESRNNGGAASGRQRISLNAGWRFERFTSNPDALSYDLLKQWILPSGNDFISGTKHELPSGTPPGGNISYVQDSFDDKSWEAVDVPHDWAIKGPFNAPGISGEMGRLPSNGVGWYRRSVTLTAQDIAAGRSTFLDIDGAMSYSAVWVNGYLVGGWPYGYNSFRLDLTGHLKAGSNLIAIRLDNALDSSRYYPGAGIYRNIWLIKADATHVGQFGTFIRTPAVSKKSASLQLTVEVENQRSTSQKVTISTKVYEYDPLTKKAKGKAVGTFSDVTVDVAAGGKASADSSATVKNPKLWGPAPAQKPNMHVAITTLSVGGMKIDTYETKFGIRSVVHDATKGVLINDEAVRIQGTCNHHDLGSLGAAFNIRAGERQLQMLQEMGGNALRTSHNPPAPELLDLSDRLGMIVLDEIFDTWSTQKKSHDFHLIFPDWHEPDLRAFIRRDRNHPSVISWSIGNEIPNQSDPATGKIAQELRNIVREEDLTRPVTQGMNNAKAADLTAQTMDIEGLNYQGEGHGADTSSTFPSFRVAFPDKLIYTSESASTVSSRGIYVFPVTKENNAVFGPNSGEDVEARHLSDYGLYEPSWGASPDKVFAAQDEHPYVAGEYVWTGWDYVGEPTPFDTSRSSYFGIIDMAGFKKDRFFQYQSRWRSDFPMAHILPHWTWPDRVGLVTPVHVFSAADEAELFVNGKSAGRVKPAKSSNRFRWDDVVYQPGDLRVVTYKNGKKWAVDTKRTVGSAAKLAISADRSAIGLDNDLSFISIAVVDSKGDTVPQASNSITFSISGPGTIVSTDNGDPTDMTAFPSLTRKAFSGHALAIVRATGAGAITVSATADGITGAKVTLKAR